MTSDSPVEDTKYVSLLWAGVDQAADVAALHGELFDQPWDEPNVRGLLDHPAATAFVAFDGRNRRVVGFIIGQLAADEAEILSIGVAKAWQGRGLGQRLVEGLARAAGRAEAKRLFLEVAVDNSTALAFYRRAGFRETGRRKGYYARPDGAVDALMLVLDIAA